MNDQKRDGQIERPVEEGTYNQARGQKLSELSLTYSDDGWIGGLHENTSIGRKKENQLC